MKEQLLSIADAANRIATGLKDAPPLSGDKIQRISVDLQPMDFSCWVALKITSPTIYWRARDESLEVIGWGSCLQTGNVFDEKADFQELEILKAQLPAGARLYGGCAFPTAGAGQPAWQGFPRSYFFLPRLEILRENERYKMCANVSGESVEELKLLLAKFSSDGLRSEAGETHPRTAVFQERMPESQQWLEQLAAAQKQIRAGNLRKIVLARCSSYRLGDSPCKVLAGFAANNSKANYKFLITLNGQDYFLGVTPERLFQREGNRLLTEAVAGTRPRGRTAAEDRALQNTLLQSRKDRQEHKLVWEWLSARLARIAANVDEPEQPTILKLEKLQHLYAALSADLHDRVTEGQILDALHPTPAVGGYPQSKALEAISGLEEFNRGWYAGAIGWISPGRSEFAVAIRSALMSEKTLHLFAGAGIVEDSVAEKEWEELNQKEISILAAIGVKPLSGHG